MTKINPPSLLSLRRRKRRFGKRRNSRRRSVSVKNRNGTRSMKKLNFTAPTKTSTRSPRFGGKRQALLLTKRETTSSFLKSESSMIKVTGFTSLESPRSPKRRSLSLRRGNLRTLTPLSSRLSFSEPGSTTRTLPRRGALRSGKGAVLSSFSRQKCPLISLKFQLTH